MAPRGRVLIIAGSDSGGGAGIQADIKTVTALGGYAATAITALTAQNTRGVFGVFGIPPDFIAQQMALVLDDIGADCLKTGMLHDSPVIETVAQTIAAHASGIPLVVDPVMRAKGGAALLEPAAAATLKSTLLPLATIITPNLPEAEALTGLRIATVAEMIAAAHALLALGPQAVLVKGGHAEGDTVIDVLASADGTAQFEHLRIHSASTHGTGCTLASAIATGLAQGMALREAVTRARIYVRAAIAAAPGFGHGHGPLAHGHAIPAYDSGMG